MLLFLWWIKSKKPLTVGIVDAADHQICAAHWLIENFTTLLNNKAKIVSDWYKNNFLPANK